MKRLLPLAAASLVLSTILLLLFSGPSSAEVARAQKLGLALEALQPGPLDFIEQEIGKRAGVLINTVRKGSPAAKAGVENGDLLISVGGKTVTTVEGVESALADAGSAVALVVVRRGDRGLDTLTFKVATRGGAPTPNPLAEAPGAPTSARPAARSGLRLAALPDATLDRVREEIGSRTGVLVTGVRPGSAGAKAGLLEGDILLTADGAMLLDPAVAMARLGDGTGRLKLVLLRGDTGSSWHVKTLPIDLGGSTPTAPSGRTARTPVEAYFAMLDFSRTQAFSREFATPPEVRRRAAALLRENRTRIDSEVLSAIDRTPAAWKRLQAKWAAAAEEDRGRQREFWRRQLVLPNPLLPLSESPRAFRSTKDAVRFEYPASWSTAQTEADGCLLLAVLPPGTEGTWDQMIDAGKAPAGVILVIAPLEDDIGQSKTLVDAARFAARKYVSSTNPGMKEVAAMDIGGAGLVALTGRLSGRSGRTFAWVGVAPFGPEHYLVGRFSGPVGRIDELLPAFTRILSTMEITPPNGAAGLSVELAAATIGNAVVSAGWPD